MNQGQLIGLAIAGVCGLVAFLGVRSLVEKPATVVREEVVTQTSQVLVARNDIPLGDTVSPDNLRWQDWPINALSPQLIERKRRPDAIKEIVGAVARAPMLPGEPVTAAKIVKIGEGGVLAAILPSGMRAFSTRIKEETGAGRMILPNDRVDVMLTVRRRNGAGAEEADTEVLFRNIRVLAIGQLIEARDGKRLAEGNTATLELTPSQAEVMAAANTRGEISFALRSIADLRSDTIAAATKKQPTDSSLVRLLRYGRHSSVRVN